MPFLLSRLSLPGFISALSFKKPFISPLSSVYSLLKLPIKGKYSLEAFVYLIRLGLKEKVAKSKANKLVHASRRRLI